VGRVDHHRVASFLAVTEGSRGRYMDCSRRREWERRGRYRFWSTRGVGPVDADVQQHRERSRCRRLSRRHEQHWRFHPADKAALIQGGIPGPWLYFLVEITSAVVLGGIAVLFVPVFGAEQLASTDSRHQRTRTRRRGVTTTRGVRRRVGYRAETAGMNLSQRERAQEHEVTDRALIQRRKNL